MNLSKQTEHHEVYAPFLAAWSAAAKKRHIHKCGIYTSQHKPGHSLFLQTQITPHRSKGVHLEFIFTASRVTGQKTVPRVKVCTYTGDNCDAGAIADAMMLIAELVAAWTALAEESEL